MSFSGIGQPTREDLSNRCEQLFRHHENTMLAICNIVGLSYPEVSDTETIEAVRNLKETSGLQKLQNTLQDIANHAPGPELRQRLLDSEPNSDVRKAMIRYWALCDQAKRAISEME